MFWNRLKLSREVAGADENSRVVCGFSANTETGFEVNVLASQASWAWPAALREVFQPRGVNLLVAEDADQFVNIIRSKRIHTTILDTDSEKSNTLTTIRIIRMDYPLLPCILLSSTAGESLLGEALRLDVFSVIGKPVDMSVLREQLNRLFIKKYNSDIFSR
jgi:DNA-binding NtrC family response regulator